MEIYYFNDDHFSVTVQVNGQLKTSPTNPHGEPSIEYFKLQAAEGKVFYIDAPEDSIPYVKVWANGHVLLSYLPQKALEELRNK